MVGFLGWEFSSTLRTAARASGTLLRSGGASHCHLEQGRPAILALRFSPRDAGTASRSVEPIAVLHANRRLSEFDPARVPA